MTLVVFLKDFTFLCQITLFTKNLNHYWKCREQSYSDDPGHNVLELYTALVQVRFVTSKTKFYICYNKLGERVAHVLPNDLRLRTLGN